MKISLKKSVVDKVKSIAEAGQELRLPAVAKSLSDLDEASALEILDGLQEQIVDDPNTWVNEAAAAMLEAMQEVEQEVEQEEVEDEAPAEEEGAPAEEEWPEEAEKAETKKITLPASTVQKVKELELPLKEVAEALSSITKEAQHAILDLFEKQWDKIRNPVEWVNAKCKFNRWQGVDATNSRTAANQALAKGSKSSVAGVAKGMGKGKNKGKNKGGSLNPATGRPYTASEQKVIRQIGYLNGTLNLARKLKYTNLKEALDMVDEKSQLRILSNFEAKVQEGAEIENPDRWLKNACYRSSERTQEFRQERWQKKQADKFPEKKKAKAEEEDWEEELPAPKKKKTEDG